MPARAYHPRAIKDARAYHPRAFKRARAYHLRTFNRSRAYRPRAFKRAIVYHPRAEVDEENIEDNSGGVEISAGAASKSEIDLNSKFEEFWRLGQEKKNKKKAKEATMLAPRHTTTEPLSKICPLTTSNSNP
uniref:Uncharacterized protein n=1 Tax=Timema tahoe TaxID=61484 RepID=A0A7R9FKR9_9NEOP|nr:unnamed protein product [Timema tahoe]